jgi:hypothetical protein
LHEWRHESRTARRASLPETCRFVESVNGNAVSRCGEFLKKMVYDARMRRNSFINADFGDTGREVARA